MNNKPPIFLEWIFKLFMREEDINHRLGDLEEMYQYISETEGNKKAIKWYLLQFLTSLPNLILNSIYWRGAMLKNYILIAFRNFRKQKVYSLLNITGLALGLACSFLILLWVQDELSYDNFHINCDKTYRVIQEKTASEIFRVPVTPAPLGSFMKENYPEVIQFTRCTTSPRILKYGDSFKKTYNNRGLFADPNFFEVFNFPFALGNYQDALKDHNSIVITEELADIFFGDKHPIGQTVLFNYVSLRVTGVIKKKGLNSHLEFNFVIPIELAKQFRYKPNDWQIDLLRTYVVLDSEKEAAILNKKAKNIISQHVQGKRSKLILQPLNEVHLHSLEGGGPIVYIYILSAIGIFILVIACINFMNLATAQSIKRSKEIGLRKVVGARREALVKQFLSESVISSFISLIFAMLFISLILPYYNELTQKNFPITSIFNIKTISSIFIITLITGLLSGSYPAMYLSSFNPLSIINGRNIFGKINSHRLRKMLVVIQFSLSIFLIIASITVNKQLDYIKNKDLGFEKENLVFMQMGKEGKNNYDSIKNDLEQNSAFANVTRTNSPLLYLGFETSNVNWEGQNADQKVNVQIRTVDFDYLSTFKMQIAEGRFFNQQFGTDSLGFVLNQKAVKAMKLDSPIGKSFTLSGMEGKIIGVVKDFHHHSLNTEIEPLCFMLNDSWSDILFTRIAKGKTSEAMTHLQNIWPRINAHSDFDVRFFEESAAKLYNNDQHLSKILNYFTLLGILIACLGLFGMASFTAEQKKKEISLRKVLGASVSKVVMMQTKEIVKWIVIANLLSWPLAYFTMTKWLENFAYKTNLSLNIFLLSGTITILIALFTVSYQTIKSALTNPIESLRNEL